MNIFMLNLQVVVSRTEPDLNLDFMISWIKGSSLHLMNISEDHAIDNAATHY